MNALILVSGTTPNTASIAAALAVREDAVLLSRDTLFDPFLAVLPEEARTAGLDQAANQALLELAYDNLHVGNPVVIASPFTREIADPMWLLSLEVPPNTRVVHAWLHDPGDTAHTCLAYHLPVDATQPAVQIVTAIRDELHRPYL